MKKSMLFFAALILCTTIALPVYACKSGQCPMKGGYGHHGKEGKGQYQCPIVEKFIKKADFFLENQKDLTLKEDQVKTIKGLKLEVEKNYVRQAAEMKVFELELHSKMSEPKVDVEGINAMIDSGMTGMAQGAKATIASYAQLKSVLNDEQMAKAKEIWLKKS